MIHACNPTSLRHTIYEAQKGHHHNVLFVHVLQDEAVAARVQTLLSTPRFRCYRTTDVTGVELGGALKNVLAIACGELHLHTRTLRPLHACAIWPYHTVRTTQCIKCDGLGPVLVKQCHMLQHKQSFACGTRTHTC